MSDFDRDSWSTPQYLYEWLNCIYSFDIDLCASKDNHKCNDYFSIEQDSLSCNWKSFGRRTGFANVPYSNIKPWVKKSIVESCFGFTTVMLIPTPNGESYYADIFKHATSITFINGRIAFYNPYLKKHVSGNTRGSCVVEFSKKHSDHPLHTYHVDRGDLKKMYG